MHLDIPAFEESVAKGLRSYPRIDKDQGRTFPFERLGEDGDLVLEIITNIPHRNIQMFGHRYLDNGKRSFSAEETAYRIRVTYRCREADPLEFPGIDNEALERNCKLGPPFAPSEFVDLVDDDIPDIGKVLPQPLSHEKRLDSLRRSNQEVRR